MKIAVVGTGYVGLVTGACFAEMGNQVDCIDKDTNKIKNLEQGVIPIHEPGLENIVIDNQKAGRLKFSTELCDSLDDAEVIFIAVGTPPGEDGSADLQYVLAVANEIGANLNHYTVIVDKSTVPVGTADKVQQAIQEKLDARGADVEFDVVSNPEFLKEGAAVNDFMRPDRVIIGCHSNKAKAVMREIYAPFTRNHERILYMGIRDAEMTKYAANAMLATKISFMNEIANLCDLMDVDIENVRKGIGSDSRIGYSFIYPGVGYGGSCFPKDVKALVHMAHDCEYEAMVLQAVESRNYAQKRVLFNKVMQRFGENLQGLQFALWGLAFKPGTDDMREAPSLVLLSQLIEAGAKIKAYDPVAMQSAEKEFPSSWIKENKLIFARNQYDAIDGVDAMILITEWKPFRHPDFDLMQRIMKKPIIFDGRNQYEPDYMKEHGFEYTGIGR